MFATFLLLVSVCSGGCIVKDSSLSTQTEQGALIDVAAKEATAIVERAQATALVLQAQAQATLVMAEVQDLSGQVSTGALQTTNSQTTPVPERPDDYREVFQATASVLTDQAPTEVQSVELVRVGFAVDSGFIAIQFRAPPEIAHTWWQGDISVTNEETGEIFNEVPVMPLLGPLISKPVQYGQVGVAMLVNTQGSLSSGDRVSVKLGNYSFEHIIVE